MPARGLHAAAQALLEQLQSFEPACHTGEGCAALVEVLAPVEKACAVARVRAAARAGACGAHHSKGFGHAADWLARQAGTTVAAAQRALQTVEQLDRLPATRDAAMAGELSLDETREIASTLVAYPGDERELLAVARTGDLRVLRDEGRRRRLAASDVEELHRRQRAARFYRHWRDEHGMVRYAGALPPEDGIAFLSRLDTETGRAQRAATRQGAGREPRERLAADALVRLVCGGGRPHARRADVVFVHDIGSGRSHVVGGGPGPAGAVRDAMQDAFVKAVLHDGTKIDTVAHYGRDVPAVLRTALELGDPPAFDGVRCGDCGRTRGLEWDHVHPAAHGGLTEHRNLASRCWAFHHGKTERDRRAGPLAGAGRGGGARAP